MARRTPNQMAWKAEGFPSEQLIVIKTADLTLDEFLELRSYITTKGHIYY